VEGQQSGRTGYVRIPEIQQDGFVAVPAHNAGTARLLIFKPQKFERYHVHVASQFESSPNYIIADVDVCQSMRPRTDSCHSPAATYSEIRAKNEIFVVHRGTTLLYWEDDYRSRAGSRQRSQNRPSYKTGRRDHHAVRWRSYVHKRRTWASKHRVELYQDHIVKSHYEAYIRNSITSVRIITHKFWCGGRQR
jgi:hypothetical protein